MVNATELRLGNWVQHEPYPDEKWKVDLELLGSIACVLVFCVGIPLTPEILVDWCGFEKWGIEDKAYITPFDRKRLILIFDDNGPEQINTYWIENVAMSEVSLTFNIEYLHQLQNLYLALFGEELTVNKPELAH